MRIVGALHRTEPEITQVRDVLPQCLLMKSTQGPRTEAEQRMTEGIVYGLTNPAMPKMVKIGRSGREIDERLNQLYSTGVSQRFRPLPSQSLARVFQH